MELVVNCDQFMLILPYPRSSSYQGIPMYIGIATVILIWVVNVKGVNNSSLSFYVSVLLLHFYQVHLKKSLKFVNILEEPCNMLLSCFNIFAWDMVYKITLLTHEFCMKIPSLLHVTVCNCTRGYQNESTYGISMKLWTFLDITC